MRLRGEPAGVRAAFAVLATDEGAARIAVPRASATVQLRTVVGIDTNDVVPALRRHLDKHGFERVKVKMARMEAFAPVIRQTARA